MSHCRVDAGGVPAEWVEAAPATDGQMTLVYLLDGMPGGDPLEWARPIAERLAAVTGARILTVACPAGPETASATAGAAAFSWLLGEGCDVGLTAFVSEVPHSPVVVEILAELRHRALPVPACPTWRVRAPGYLDRGDGHLAEECSVGLPIATAVEKVRF